jgi:hypothetical protein
MLVLVTALALAFSAGVAQAAVTLTVSKPEAAAGEEVPFKIDGTQMWAQYELFLENELIARGEDTSGGGIDQKFLMPDFGGAEKDVTLKAVVQQPGAPTAEEGTFTMRYLLVPKAPAGPTTQPQPEPVVLEPEPAAAVAPPASKGTTPSKKQKKSKATPQSKQDSGGGGGTNKNKNKSKSESGGSSPNTNSTAPTTPATSIPPSSSGGASPKSGITPPVVQKPSGPTGAGGVLPPSVQPPAAVTGSSVVPTPVSGTATLGGGGFPTALLVALMLLGLAALVFATRRIAGRYLPGFGGRLSAARRAYQAAGNGNHRMDDEMRLDALGRAARSGAEFQQKLAARRASRTAGRAS